MQDAATTTTEETTAAPVTTAATTTAATTETKTAETNGKTAPTTTVAGTKTIAGGAESDDDDEGEAGETDEKADKPNGEAKTWPADWREQIAKHAAAGDEKAYKKELARLQRIATPEGMYGSFRELDKRLNGGGLIKVPGKDATPEERAAYHKALGVPEKPEDYFKDLKLENGAEIGDLDKPIVGKFAEALHKVGAPPVAMKAALDWYYAHQEEEAAAQDEADDTFRREAEKMLKEELGPAYKRTTNAIPSLFKTAPGGPDAKNENALFARLMGGRMADGRVIGNDPDMLRFMASLVTEINPAATVVEDGIGSVQSVNDELANIQKLRSTDPKKYNSDEVQTRERELIAAQLKMRGR